MGLKFEAGKRYVTRSGHIAVIDQISPGAGWNLIGRAKGKSGSCMWNMAGRYDREGDDHALDLMEELSESKS